MIFIESIVVQMVEGGQVRGRGGGGESRVLDLDGLYGRCQQLPPPHIPEWFSNSRDVEIGFSDQGYSRFFLF